MNASCTSPDRYGIYYWKCDRAAAFYGTEALRSDDGLLGAQLRRALEQRFPGTPLRLRPAGGQGNHRTFRLSLGAKEAFVRIEDGPERDNYFDVESLVIAAVRDRQVPAPRVLACDTSRTETAFAWQVLEYVPHPNLNESYKQGALPLGEVAESIGEAVARWQAIRTPGFGPFSALQARQQGFLAGLHECYARYYRLNLERHVAFLVAGEFFTDTQAAAVLAAIDVHRHLLELSQGCLVHKDLALWNILGTPPGIAAYIDWDDAISGDPLDDLSLLGCFYDASVIDRALAGYTRILPLPEQYVPRFWLHLLRNMLVKAVIRVGAGYFRRNDSFFLIGSGSTGADLERFTRQRIEIALRGLNEDLDLSTLR
jgi:aminoglycoside phosphotransferase (APT) family kinase protein